jgi:hypothetical protein
LPISTSGRTLFDAPETKPDTETHRRDAPLSTMLDHVCFPAEQAAARAEGLRGDIPALQERRDSAGVSTID